MTIRFENNKKIEGHQLLSLRDDLEIDLAHDELDELDHAKQIVEEGDTNPLFDEAEEYLALLEVIEELEGYTQVQDVTLIRADQMVEEARETAECFARADVDFDRWPFSCIDWDEAGDELAADYSLIEIGNIAYYYRD